MNSSCRFAYIPMVVPGSGFRVGKVQVNHPAPVAEPEFLPPRTWAEAVEKADQLNKQLGLGPEEVQQIVDSATAAAKAISPSRPSSTISKQVSTTSLPLIASYYRRGDSPRR
jgi:hypothetical protein